MGVRREGEEGDEVKIKTRPSLLLDCPDVCIISRTDANLSNLYFETASESNIMINKEKRNIFNAIPVEIL